MEYSVVERATGRILRFGECQQEVLELLVHDITEAIILGAYHDILHYVEVDPTVDKNWLVIDRDAELRPQLPAILSKTTIAANGVDEATIIGLPKPCKFRLDGIDHETTDGTIEISSRMPATYVIEIDHWPYLPWRAEIKAT